MADNPTLTPQLLLTITKELVHNRLCRSFGPKNRPDRASVMVTWEDIEDTADALKFNVFYIPTYVYSEAMILARDQGCLRDTKNKWITLQRTTL